MTLSLLRDAPFFYLLPSLPTSFLWHLHSSPPLSLSLTRKQRNKYGGERFGRYVWNLSSFLFLSFLSSFFLSRSLSFLSFLLTPWYLSLTFQENVSGTKETTLRSFPHSSKHFECLQVPAFCGAWYYNDPQWDLGNIHSHSFANCGSLKSKGTDVHCNHLPLQECLNQAPRLR